MRPRTAISDSSLRPPKGGVAPKEEIAWMAASRLPGLDLLRARYTRQVFARHFHEGYALGVIEGGALRFRYLGRDHVAAPGAVNLVAPGETHDGHGVGDAGWAYRMFYLAPGIVRMAGEEAGLPHGALPDFASGVLADPELAAAIDALHRDMERAGPCMPTLAQETRLSAVLARWITRHAAQRMPAARPPRASGEPVAVRRARDYLDAHCADDVRLADLAGVACLSPFHLARAFAAAVGLPPHAYLVQARVRRARDLLSAGSTPAEAAAAAGFADQSHLTRAFRAQMGVTPARFRKMLQDARGTWAVAFVENRISTEDSHDHARTAPYGPTGADACRPASGESGDGGGNAPRR
ncbi:AraC family transcriptional regulator [Nitratidesulfovibrio liaohensis]|uniref:AraC family transcriptional regulator n=1 Tax=Nitratidesulfovibrio liaohensis TaxID=2604158 RepID=A0ABY9R3T6_9BACT|nr:AraC family transcriptional regulator [Nitratidesulfovibrio liaohensis]WMW66426.1 AraC family transcriptional regulator [Nitratidesulfovibrio liaohensis]